MNKIFIFLFPVIIFILSCNGQHVSQSKAIRFYDSINHQVNLTRAIQQKFIDSTTSAISKVKQNKNIIIDTFQLFKLLDSAKDMNRIRLKSIENIIEVDPELNYKNKIVNHVKSVSFYYDNAFRECIQILGSTSIDRYDKSRSLMMPALLDLKLQLNEIQTTKNDFKNKYNFTAPSQ